MCLAIPAKVISIDSNTNTAIAALGEIKKEISLALVEGVKVNDYVLIHVGYALERIDPQEADKTLALFEQVAELEMSK